VRDAIGEAMVRFVDALAEGRVPTEAEIAGRVGLTGP
jgi:hypothetical protein